MPAFGGLPEELEPENGEHHLLELDPARDLHSDFCKHTLAPKTKGKPFKSW